MWGLGRLDGDTLPFGMFKMVALRVLDDSGLKPISPKLYCYFGSLGKVLVGILHPSTRFRSLGFSGIHVGP